MNGTPASENVAVDDCEHHYETRLLGGHPLHVRLCQLCRKPDWVELGEQAAELYRKGWEARAKDARPERADVPLAADIQIVATGHTTEDTMAGSLISPNGLRINGQSVITNGPVRIDEIGLANKDRGLVTVNVTLVARRLTIGAEGDIDGESCTACGASEVAYRNYREQPFCRVCMDPYAFVPPAAEGLTKDTLDIATSGANDVDAWALTGQGRNFLAHALAALHREGWLRDKQQSDACGEECSEGHTYAGGCEQAKPSASKASTCDCGFEHGRPAEYDSPDRHPPRQDAAPDPRREVVAKALNGRDAASEWGEISERTRAVYCSRADAVLAALDAHDGRTTTRLPDEPTDSASRVGCPYCITPPMARSYVRQHVSRMHPEVSEQLRAVIREEIRLANRGRAGR